ncbi:FprA family A-type flavoprotein [Allobaculum mucilyticum]|uniref:FprA family A-type flavoprotein n=1 Tax=Allobaculum mucilyticum TaxID=2834459 RepID=UPI001E57FE01|nr:MBL fold metallo-hydrolase [Allobaculum mucilyticum]UNT96878.1 FprA family A-type flavoprotein [Allobaculum mucilyticum]
MEKVSNTVYSVGCDDYTIDLFESQYKVPNGMAYNSYLIKDGKNVLMDTVDQRKGDEWLANVEEVLNGEPLDYLVIQHLEPDHSGSIDKILRAHPEAKVVASVKAWTMLPNFEVTPVPEDHRIAVKEGDVLDLGTRKLSFVTAPMVHWPEVIVTYDDKDKILFAADAFGKFGTRDAEEPWDDEARRYFINIVGKYGNQVQTLLKKAAGLDIQTIAALHGPLLTENLGHYIRLYDTWSKYEPETDEILILVASIHGHTNVVADKMKEILEAKGQKVRLLDVTRQDMHEAVAQCYRCGKIVLIACSYDAGLFPPMERVLLTLSHKNFQNRSIGVIQNGSWAPSAARTVKSILEGCKNLTWVDPVVTITTSLKDKDLPAMEELADHLIEA